MQVGFDNVVLEQGVTGSAALVAGDYPVGTLVIAGVGANGEFGVGAIDPSAPVKTGIILEERLGVANDGDAWVPIAYGGVFNKAKVVAATPGLVLDSTTTGELQRRGIHLKDMIAEGA